MTTYHDVVQAFKEGRKLRAGNYESTGDKLYLFGNLVAEKTKYGTIRVTDAGYPTHTTHKTLRALGVKIQRKNFETYIGGTHKANRYTSGDSRYIRARKGYHGTVRKPTRFLVGEGGRPERVNISPIKKHGTKSHSHLGIGKVNLGNIKIRKFV